MENKRKQFGFTLVELVVAIGILVLMIGFASMLFRISIETRRLTGANAEISQKFKTIAEQLNRDFKGIQKDAPMFVWFHQNFNEPNDDPNNRYDQIMFFANGSFQSQNIAGTTARIYYGQARIAIDASSSIYPFDQIFDQSPKKIEHHKAKTLARQQYIYSSQSVKWYYNNFVNYNDPNKDYFETDCMDISQWKSTDFSNYVNNNVIAATFNRRAYIDFMDPNTIHNIFCEGVASFGIQLAYPFKPDSASGDDRVRWFWYPSTNLNDGGSSMTSHFDLLPGSPNMFGINFNVQNPSDYNSSSGYWYKIGNTALEYSDTSAGLVFIDKYFPTSYFPKAIKFTFRIYDSKGIIKNGRLFTYIVYLGD